MRRGALHSPTMTVLTYGRRAVCERRGTYGVTRRGSAGSRDEGDVERPLVDLVRRLEMRTAREFGSRTTSASAQQRKAPTLAAPGASSGERRRNGFRKRWRGRTCA